MMLPLRCQLVSASHSAAWSQAIASINALSFFHCFGTDGWEDIQHAKKSCSTNPQMFVFGKGGRGEPKNRNDWRKTHTHLFNGPFSGTIQVSRYQKGKTKLDFTEERDSEWQWHQLGHMQVSTLLQTDNHASTPPLFFYRPDALPATQPTASKHWRQKWLTSVNPHPKKNNGKQCTG